MVSSGTTAGQEGVAPVDALVVALFRDEGTRLVSLARLFVDDRTAAEDLVQEAFIRLARNAHRIRDEERAAAYLRSIVINLARDHNRRGLVSVPAPSPDGTGRPLGRGARSRERGATGGGRGTARAAQTAA